MQLKGLSGGHRTFWFGESITAYTTHSF